MKYYKKINFDTYFAAEVCSVQGRNVGVKIEIDEGGSMFYNQSLTDEELELGYREITEKTFATKFRLATSLLRKRLIK
jgi:hypothetical protein